MNSIHEKFAEPEKAIKVFCERIHIFFATENTSLNISLHIRARVYLYYAKI